VVRRVLSEVAQTGLPGEHHFFITFDTRHPGVRISSRLRAQYPQEMTVVLQHQFWDLNITESAFEVGLSFKGVPERLLGPFRAISSFIDPHVSFGLKFDSPGEAATAAKAEMKETPAGLPAPIAEPPTEPAAAPAGGAAKADVVSLDAFRKKNG
jgi:hypothetical protein